MTPTVFMSACIIDIIFGDPHWFPHPVVIIGRFVKFLEGNIRSSAKIVGEKNGGIILWFATVIPTYFMTWGLVESSLFISSLFGMIVMVLLGSLTLALRSLFEESKVVLDALNSGNIKEARDSLSMIVGRDTEDLNEEEIYRAIIETVSENLSDGIIAPMLYLTLGGVPLAMAYKAVNTLDSMVGYKTPGYRDIGCFCAKMDDIFNWIPARITGLIIIVSAFFLRLNWKDSWRILLRDRKNHASPNSGIPEAAIAGSLGIQIGGKSRYFGTTVYKPTIGDRTKETDTRDIKNAWAIMFVSSLLMALVCTMILWTI
jgi:adenosylcobinamide-phosphate synthase